MATSTSKENAVPTVPAKKPYRVAIVGATYIDPIEGYAPDGTPGIINVYKVGAFGEEIELTEFQANRLLALGAVKPTDEPLSYDEMNDKQLDAAIAERGVSVRSSGADGDKPLRTDKINALNTFDQGRGISL